MHAFLFRNSLKRSAKISGQFRNSYQTKTFHLFWRCKPVIKKRDALLLASLRDNARITLTELSKQLNVPISTLYERLKQAEGTLIKRFTAIVDFAQMGYHVKVELLLKVQNSQKDRLKGFLMACEHVNKLQKLNNSFDFCIEGYFKTIVDVDHFVESIEREFPIVDRAIYYVTEDLMNEMFFSNNKAPQLIDWCCEGDINGLC
jgi:Lrp/AsnC family transcriptional regulator, regulator for asnA, asnC and gidA